MITGYINLSSYHKRIGHRDDPHYDRCNMGEKTVMHSLCVCPAWRNLRSRTHEHKRIAVCGSVKISICTKRTCRLCLETSRVAYIKQAGNNRRTKSRTPINGTRAAPSVVKVNMDWSWKRECEWLLNLPPLIFGYVPRNVRTTPYFATQSIPNRFSVFFVNIYGANVYLINKLNMWMLKARW